MVTKPVTKEDIPNEAKFMTEFWAMVKETYTLPDDPEDNDYWTDILQRARQIDKDCNSRMGQFLLNAYMDYLTEKKSGEFRPYRSMAKKGDGHDT